MSDFAWIALIIIVYLVVIKPMFQGIVQNPNMNNGKNSNKNNKNNNPPRNNNSNKERDDYVDYEEIK